MNLRSICFATAVAAASLPAHAVTTVQWDFENAVAPSAGTTWTGIASSTGTGTASSLHANSASFSTPAGNGSPKSVSANGWSVGDYWQFSFSMTGYSGLSVSFDQVGSATGPKDFALAYSTNGVTFTNFAAYVVPVSAFSPTSTQANATFTYDLSAVTALNNQASVVLRLVDSSTTSINLATVLAAGTDRVDNFTVSATPVPEPETYAMLLAGLGVIGFLGKRRKG